MGFTKATKTIKISTTKTELYIQEAITYNRDGCTSIFLVVSFTTSRNSDQSDAYQMMEKYRTYTDEMKL